MVDFTLKRKRQPTFRSSLQPLLPACLAQPEGRGLVRIFGGSAWLGKTLQMGLAREHEPKGLRMPRVE